MSDIDEREEVYCFDIDGCLGEEKIGDCLNAKPNNRRISEVNSLYRKGATIYLMTSRGMVSNNNDQVKADKEMRTATEKQLKEWGVEYHQLFFGKPRAKYYIDDRGWNDYDFFSQF